MRLAIAAVSMFAETGAERNALDAARAGDLPDAQDISQDVFLKLYRNLSKLETAGVATWLYRVTVNACRDHHRRHYTAVRARVLAELAQPRRGWRRMVWITGGRAGGCARANGAAEARAADDQARDERSQYRHLLDCRLSEGDEMMRLILAAVMMMMVVVVPLCAQQNTTKLVTVKYADPEAIVGMIRMFGVNVQYNSGLKTLALNGQPDSINAAEAAIKQLDVAPKNIELMVYFLVAGTQPTLSTGIPARFKEYGMLDTLTLRTRTGTNAETSGVLDASSMPRMTVFSIRSVTVSDDGTIRIDRMHAGVRIPVANQSKVDYMNTGIDQSIDVKAGQKVVVGRASLAGPEKALFLILTAKVVE